MDNDNDNVSYMFGNDVYVDTEELDDTVTISRQEYEELLENAVWLSVLESAGVDNWEGIDFAHQLYEGVNRHV